jgi:hypothetical protein
MESLHLIVCNQSEADSKTVIPLLYVRRRREIKYLLHIHYQIQVMPFYLTISFHSRSC